MIYRREPLSRVRSPLFPGPQLDGKTLEPESLDGTIRRPRLRFCHFMISDWLMKTLPPTRTVRGPSPSRCRRKYVARDIGMASQNWLIVMRAATDQSSISRLRSEALALISIS